MARQSSSSMPRAVDGAMDPRPPFMHRWGRNTVFRGPRIPVCPLFGFRRAYWSHWFSSTRLDIARGAWILGRRVIGERKPGRVVAFLEGALLRVLAFVPIAHIFVFMGPAIYGLGAPLVTPRGARMGTQATSVK